MSCIPFWKGCNKNIEYVDRSHRGLNHVPDELQRYSHCLEELILDSNHIRDLPKGFYRLSQLRKLTLSDNQIEKLSPDIGNFIQLAELDVSRNELSQIPENIKLCKCLQTVDFSCNPLEILPSGIVDLKSLTKLCLNDIRLTVLPASIGNLINLEILELRDNAIDTLPAAISFLTSLRTLDLGGNLLQSVPEFIGCLYSLEELRLDCNDISYVPQDIGKLKKLMQLDLSDNCVEHIPRELSELTSLTDLLLSFNRIQQLPEGIGHLRKLCTLKLDMNQLDKLPSLIGGCHALQELILTENLLTELPPTIGQLKSLVILNADRNKLTCIPAEIGCCHRLSVLSVRDNVICSLPSELGSLRQLHVLDVSRNRLHSLPLSLSSCDLKAIWLSESQAQPLLSFQQDIDEETGEKVLTCFLLPQPGCTKPAESVLNNSSAVISVTSSVTEVNQPSHSSVKFAEEEQEEHGERQCHLVRQSTPHPKELRARHSRASSADRISSQLDGVGSNPDLTGSCALPDVSRRVQTDEPCLPSETPTKVKRALASRAIVDIDELDIESKTSSQLSLAMSLLSDAITESSATYDTARENLSDDTLTANDLSSSLDSTFDSPDGFEYKTNSCSSSTSDLNIISVPPSIQTVIRVIRKPGTALGISIAGGRGSVPFIGHDDGIFISRVTPEGACDRAGIELGDRVMSVNAESLVNATHRRAVHVLKNAGDDILMIVIKAGMSNINQEDISERDGTSLSCSPCDEFSDDNTLKRSVRKRSTRRRLTTDENCNSVNVIIPTVLQGSKGRDQCNDSILATSVDDSFQSACAVWQLDEISNSISPDDAVSLNLYGITRNDVTSNEMGPVDSVEESMQSGQAFLNGTGTDVDNPQSDPDLPVVSVSRGDNDVQRGHGLSDSSYLDDVCPEDIDLNSLSSAVCAGSNSQHKNTQRELDDNDADSNSSTVCSFDAFKYTGSDCIVTSCDSTDPLIVYPVEEIVIIKTGGSLGISIVGGRGQTSHPYGMSEPGVFVSKILASGPAARTTLQVGDRILSVNGKDIRTATHQEAVSALVAPKKRLKLSVRHDPLPVGFQEIKVELSAGDSLGISVQGGYGSVCGNRYDKTDEGIFVSRIAKNSAVARDGRLVVGHRLLEVNGRCLLGASHTEALTALESCDTCAVLTISDGYNHLRRRSSRSRCSSTLSLSSIASTISTYSTSEANGDSLNRNRRVRVKRVKRDEVTCSSGDDVADQSDTRTGEQLALSADVGAGRPQSELNNACQQLIVR